MLAVVILLGVDVGVTVIVIEVVAAGVVNLYHTSLVVPHVAVGLPVAVAWYKFPAKPIQPVLGVIVTALAHKSFTGWANKPVENSNNKDVEIQKPARCFFIEIGIS